MRRFQVTARHQCEPFIVQVRDTDAERVQIDLSPWVEDNEAVTSVQLVSKSGNGGVGTQAVDATNPANINIEYTLQDHGKAYFELLLRTANLVKTVPILMVVMNTHYTDDYGVCCG